MYFVSPLGEELDSGNVLWFKLFTVERVLDLRKIAPRILRDTDNWRATKFYSEEVARDSMAQALINTLCLSSHQPKLNC